MAMLEAGMQEKQAPETSVETLAAQFLSALRKARSESGMFVPRFATISVQVHEGRVTGLQVTWKYRPSAKAGS